MNAPLSDDLDSNSTVLFDLQWVLQRFPEKGKSKCILLVGRLDVNHATAISLLRPLSTVSVHSLTSPSHLNGCFSATVLCAYIVLVIAVKAVNAAAAEVRYITYTVSLLYRYAIDSKAPAVQQQAAAAVHSLQWPQVQHSPLLPPSPLPGRRRWPHPASTAAASTATVWYFLVCVPPPPPPPPPPPSTNGTAAAAPLLAC